jgi:hypothetical protein
VVVTVATPATVVAVPNVTLLLFTNVTTPVGVPPLPATVAVRTTLVPCTDVLGAAVSVVVVAVVPAALVQLFTRLATFTDPNPVA